MEHDDESIESVSTSSSSSADTRVYIGHSTGDGEYADICTDGDVEYGTMTGHEKSDDQSEDGSIYDLTDLFADTSRVVFTATTTITTTDERLYPDINVWEQQ